MNNNTPPVIVWFRHDLRLQDHPALSAAGNTASPLIPVYIFDSRQQYGGASRWWLHHSLAALQQQFKDLGGYLLLRRGAAEQVLTQLANETGARAIYCSRQYEPLAVASEQSLKQQLASQATLKRFPGTLLAEPETVLTGAGQPYKVFTPFWRCWQQRLNTPALLGTPDHLRFSSKQLATERLDDWGLLPARPNWARDFPQHWQPGEVGAREALTETVNRVLPAYLEQREYPGQTATTRLSPHLRFGEVSPRQVVNAVTQAGCESDVVGRQSDGLIRQLAWREFSYAWLFHQPELLERPFQKKFSAFRWRDDPHSLRCWQQGLTGYPLVDAGMRQLWASGWMHNRVRMVVASFLVKHLLIHWTKGAAWFWDTLVDADWANNTAGWQWVAGCGADAAPYFRVFNPILQSQKFDSEGDYIRRWVPELAHLSSRLIHQPWLNPGQMNGYPMPIIEHKTARQRALSAYQELSRG